MAKVPLKYVKRIWLNWYKNLSNDQNDDKNTFTQNHFYYIVRFTFSLDATGFETFNMIRLYKFGALS